MSSPSGQVNDLVAPKSTESTLRLPDGHELYTKTWLPSPSAAGTKARLVWLHGFSDHCNWYDDLFAHFTSRGIKVYSFDQRGWGQSVREPRHKGLSGGTEKVMEDITAFIKHVLDTCAGDEDETNTPLFLGGHSMGGAETLYYLATGPKEIVRRIRGAVLEAPFLAQPPATRANPLVVMAGRAASRFLPARQMVQKLDKKFVSRDADVNDRWDRDKLCHDTGTLEGLAGMLSRGAELSAGSVVVGGGRDGYGGGIWVGHGTADAIADFGAVKAWFEACRVEDKEMAVFEGGFHKLHCEPHGEGARYGQMAGEWMAARCDNNAKRPGSAGVGRSSAGTEDRPKL